MILESNRKGNVSVKFLENKIAVKATPSAVERAKDKAELMSDGDDNPFLAKEDDDFPGAAESKDQPSPRKKYVLWNRSSDRY